MNVQQRKRLREAASTPVVSMETTPVASMETTPVASVEMSVVPDIKFYELSLMTENTLRVLQRITTVFSRHRINIERLTVFETEQPGVSQFYVVIQCSTTLICKMMKQLQRIIELLEIRIYRQFLTKEEWRNQ